ncbi:MAG TPA: nucleotidyltransferase domain-containing protein [Candidatus Nanoarchaeia archaeon]|nr:nucleotidyltransferase domain-containing protein [Candidatus Nanoarchaeia archaeon]
MIKKSQLNIMNLFKKNTFLKKTIREISLLLKKDYPNTYNAIIELEKEGLLKIEKIGKSKVCSIELNQKTISLLSFLDEQESFEANIPNMIKILNFKEFNEDIILVTGSYVLGKQSKNSDIDLVLIVKEKTFEKQRLLENITSLMIPKVHALVFSYKDFIDMLLDKKPNLGKEIFNKRLIFKNTTKYYNLINEAIEHGFRD